MDVWLIKEVFYQRKRHYLTIVSICISIVLVLLVNIISFYIIENINLSFKQLGLNISSIQLLEKRNDFWIENLLEKYGIKEYSSYNKKELKDYKIIGCDSSLSNVFTFNLESGNFLTEIDNLYNDNQAVIGNKLKQYFNCYEINELICVNGITFRVVGILEENCNNIYEDFDECLFIFNDYVINYDQSSFYFVSEEVFNEEYLNEILGKDNFIFIDQNQTKNSLTLLLDLIRRVLIVLAFVSVIVSIISLVNNSLNNIQARMKEIGIKKSLGASGKDIYLQLFFENSLIYLIGIIISLMIVFVVVEIINVSSKVKISIDWFDNIKYIVLILLIGSICNIYPAKKASKITIIETIRNKEFS